MGTMQMADGHPAYRVGALVAMFLVVARRIGRCKGCGASAKLEGRIARGEGSEMAAVSIAGDVYSTTVIGDASIVLKRCACGRFAVLRKVTEGTKNSKHTCGARCTNATGPSCDCRCKGANHGSSC